MLNQPVRASSITRTPTVALQDRFKAGGDDSIRQQLLGLWVVVCVEALQTGAGFLETALVTVTAMQLLLKSLSLAARARYISGHVLETDNTVTSGLQLHGTGLPASTAKELMSLLHPLAHLPNDIVNDIVCVCV